MDATLFNIHDLILISTAIECCLFAFILFFKTRNKSPARLERIFIAILLARALICIHEVTFWGRDLQAAILDISPNLFFIGNIAYFIEGPLLLLFVYTFLEKKPSLHELTLFLILPIAIYLSYMGISYYALDTSTKRQLIESRDVAYSWHFLLVDFFGKGLRSAISLYCILSVKRKIAEVRHHAAAKFWIFLVTFSALLLWELLLDAVKIIGIWVDIPVDLLVFMGVSSYYAMFLFLNLLIFSNSNLDTATDSLVRSSEQAISTRSKTREQKVVHQPDEIDKKILEHIDSNIQQKRLYAHSDLTLEKLASELELAPKTLSLAINRYRDMNFYEFINNYRADAAKALLEVKAENGKYALSVTDILHQVGFNSKSVFNTFFKKKFGQTPTQFRKSFHEQQAEDTQKRTR